MDRQRDGEPQVAPISFIEVMFLDLDREQKVAWWISILAVSAFAAKANGLAVLYARWNAHLEPFLVHGPAGSLTALALHLEAMSGPRAGYAGKVDSAYLGSACARTGGTAMLSGTSATPAVFTSGGATDFYELLFFGQEIVDGAGEALFDISSFLWSRLWARLWAMTGCPWSTTRKTPTKCVEQVVDVHAPAKAPATKASATATASGLSPLSCGIGIEALL
jgi:hypothetical protein